MSTARAQAAMPVAAKLIAAVAARDAEQVEKILTRSKDLYALAVVLADQASLPKRLPNDADPVFTDAERRRHHAAFVAGRRDAMTVLGEREYQREQKRRRREEGPVALTDGHWEKRGGGVRVWVPDSARSAS